MQTGQSLQKLFSLHNFGIKLGLDNIKKFLNYLGNPEKKINAVHIAGSNGKGSTASFIASILQQAGYSTGLYTSPHFVRFNERILLNNQQIDDFYISNFIDEHEKFIDDYGLTFFEVTTAMAFLYFANNNPDYCIIETGLGGRLDATNVLLPLAAVITSVSLEHTNILGNTIEEIAFEKSEIIKPGSKVFIGMLPQSAEKLIEEKCAVNKNELYNLKNFIEENNSKVNFFSPKIKLNNLTTPLKGKYQKHNAALASLLVSELNVTKDEVVIKNGITNIFENTGLQGRYEYFSKSPAVIFDAAHNPESVKNFVDEFRTEVKNYQKSILLFGAMQDKNIKQMLLEFKPYFDEIYFTEINYERSARIEDVKNIFEELNIEFKTAGNSSEFVISFLEKSSKNCLVAAGSIYLLGEIKSGLRVNIT